jgi:hypothetical protein
MVYPGKIQFVWNEMEEVKAELFAVPAFVYEKFGMTFMRYMILLQGFIMK